MYVDYYNYKTNNCFTKLLLLYYLYITSTFWIFILIIINNKSGPVSLTDFLHVL